MIELKPYLPPDGFSSAILPPEPHELGPGAMVLKLCEYLARQASIPRLRPDADVSDLPDDALTALAGVVAELQIAEARNDAAAFVEYALSHEKTGEPLENGEHHNEWHRFLDENRRAILFAPVEHAKALPLATRIPTPFGYRAMGDLQVGDLVFGRTGQPTTIVAKSRVFTGKSCYRIRFEDGGEIDASGDHLWSAWTQSDRDEHRAPRVLTTEDMLRAGLRHRRSWQWKIPLCEPVRYPERDLPIDPYVFGLWLGNGSSDSGLIHLNALDADIAETIGRTYETGANRTRRGCTSLAVLGIRGHLVDLGVLGAKSIPSTYLLGSERQRRELLAGLLDSDGTPERNGREFATRVSFSTTIEAIARSVAELARSLGERVGISEGRAKVNGKDCGPYWRVSWTPRFECPFRGQRKSARFALASNRSRVDSRTIVAIDEIESVDTQCIAVENGEHLFLAGSDYTVTHNTTHIAVGRVLWTLGKDPNARLALISNTADQAQKILGVVRLNIESNPKVREVFPDLKPSIRKSDRWHSSAITVERSTFAKDPSIQALGVGGPLVGSRLDGCILDDVLDFENTRTAEQMQKLVDWCESTLFTRMTAGAWLHIIGTPWHQLDLLHVLEKRKGFVTKRYSAILNPTETPDRWIPLWPKQFSLQRLREIYDQTTPHNFARKYLCQVNSAETQRFQQAWIDAAIVAGKPYQRFPLAPLKSGGGVYLPCFTGVDLAVGKTTESDLTAIFTIAVDDRGRRIVVNLESGRWQAPEIISRVKAQHDLYGSMIVVEDNGAQAFLLQWIEDCGLPVTPFTTGARNKYDERFGVESLAIELKQGHWVIPSGYDGGLHPELQAWIAEMLMYDPQGHTGDRLMASWFARESARSHGLGIQRKLDTLSRG